MIVLLTDALFWVYFAVFLIAAIEEGRSTIRNRLGVALLVGEGVIDALAALGMLLLRGTLTLPTLEQSWQSASLLILVGYAVIAWLDTRRVLNRNPSPEEFRAYLKQLGAAIGLITPACIMNVWLGFARWSGRKSANTKEKFHLSILYVTDRGSLPSREE